MATMQYASFGDTGECRFLITYNANNGRVQSLDCINNTPFPAWGAVRNPNDGQWTEQTFPANQTTSRTVPAGFMTVRVTADPEVQGYSYLEARIDATGQWVNLETQFRYPA